MGGQLEGFQQRYKRVTGDDLELSDETKKALLNMKNPSKLVPGEMSQEEKNDQLLRERAQKFGLPTALPVN